VAAASLRPSLAPRRGGQPGRPAIGDDAGRFGVARGRPGGWLGRYGIAGAVPRLPLLSGCTAIGLSRAAAWRFLPQKC